MTASHTRVKLGGATTLFCNVTRTNPEVNGIFLWENVRTGRAFSETSDSLALDISATEDFGAYRCTVTNAAQGIGSGNVTIEQGCELIYISVILHL